MCVCVCLCVCTLRLYNVCSLLQHVMEEPLFNTLRTKQQLGELIRPNFPHAYAQIPPLVMGLPPELKLEHFNFKGHRHFRTFSAATGTINRQLLEGGMQ